MKSDTEALYYRSASNPFGLFQQAIARIRERVVARVQDVERDEVRAKYREEHGEAIKVEVRIEINWELKDIMR